MLDKILGEEKSRSVMLPALKTLLKRNIFMIFGTIVVNFKDMN